MSHPYKAESDKSKAHKAWATAGRDRSGDKWGSKIKTAIKHSASEAPAMKAGGKAKAKRADKSKRSGTKNINIIIPPKRPAAPGAMMGKAPMPQMRPPMPQGMAMQGPPPGAPPQQPPMKRGGKAIRKATGGSVTRKAGGGGTSAPGGSAERGKRRGGGDGIESALIGIAPQILGGLKDFINPHMKDGGRSKARSRYMAGGKVKLTGGSGGGEGRIEKQKAQRLTRGKK